MIIYKFFKMKSLIFTSLFLFIALSFSTNLQSQNFNKYKGTSSHHATTSFNEIVNWDKAHPAPDPKKKVPNKEVFKYPEFSIDGKKVLYKEEKPQGNNYTPMSKDPSPLPDKDFLGLNDNNNSIPPDVNGAAGPNHLMITLNTETRIMDKEGNEISTVDIESFWHSLPGYTYVFDPKITYDPYENRWIFLMPSGYDFATSRLNVAVSENSDPTGNWFLYSFDTNPNVTHGFDYPNFGFNKNWIVVSGNMFGDGTAYTALFVLDKHDLYNNALVADYSRFEIYDGFTLIPAKTYDTEEEDIYIVNNAGGNIGGYGYLALRKVTGGYGNEYIEELGIIQIADPWEDGSYANNGDFAPQLGTDEKINTVDARLENMIYRNGKLWTAHHIYLPADDPTRCSVQWFELALDGTILQRGRVDDPDGNMCYAFATIAVNANEDIMIGYNSYSPEQYASGSYSFRYADDPQNTLRDSYQYIDGLAPYFKTFGGNRNRWGDYSGTVVDPVDDLDFWTLQEYADLPGSQDQWSTWWAYIDIDAVPEAQFEANITTVPTGNGVDFMDLTKYEPTAWLWEFEGGTPSTSTQQNPHNIVYEDSGLFDVTLTATNYLGSNTLIMEEYIKSSTSILPEIQFTVSDTIPCIGDPVQFEDQTIYNPIQWEWEFFPNDVTFVNGTNENSQNPEVKFNIPYHYEVTLSASNLNGSSSITKNALVHVGGVGLPFGEDFESGYLCDEVWTIENPDNKKTWTLTTVAGSEPGDISAYVNIKNYNGMSERDRLISPLINLSDYNEAYVEFQYAYAQRFAQYTDSLIVYLSTGCGDDLIRLLAMGEDSLNQFATVPPTGMNFIPESADDWCGAGNNPECININLTTWVGNPDIQIVFESYNGFGNNIFIDNVKIDGTLSAIDEIGNVSDKLNVYPNPTNGSFTVQLKNVTGIAELKLLNITGQVILTDQIDCSEYVTLKRFNLDKLNNGIYLVQVQTMDELLTCKIVIK